MLTYSTPEMFLPPELYGEIAAFLDGEIHTLYSCALVCRAFHRAATPLLYRRIHVSPPKVGLAWQVVEDTLGRKPFATARLPSRAGYVEEFTLDGYITKIRPSRQTPVPIIDKIPGALQMWQNLQTVTLTPQKATGPALLNIIKALRHCPLLRVVTVNELSMKEHIIPDLAQIDDLQSLTLLNPTRALFMVLNDWIMRMEDTLANLHLLGNCGPLTPGILRNITPRLENIQSLAIGLSYSLTDLDVSTCLSQLTSLKSLRIRYYRQRALPPASTFLALRHLIVLHTQLSSKDEANSLSAWIRQIFSSSPLETLQTICLNDAGPSLCFDGLIFHIANRHHQTLRVIRMPKAYVRGPSLDILLEKCTGLQTLALTVSYATLKSFPAMTDKCAKLHTVSLSICDNPRLIIEQKDAQKALQRVPQLRSITVNNISWKGQWVAQKDEAGTTYPEFLASLVTNVEQQSKDEL